MKLVPYMGRKFPITNKFECPKCHAKIHEKDDQVINDFYFCSKCSQYFYIREGVGEEKTKP